MGISTKRFFFFITAGQLLSIALAFAVLALNGVDPTKKKGIILHTLLLLNLLFSLYSGSLQFRSIQVKQGLSFFFYILTGANVILSMETTARILPYIDTSDRNPGVAFFYSDLLNFPFNSDRFLDYEFVPRRTPEKYRVLVIGNSFAQGAGLHRTDTFSREAERELNRYLAENGHPHLSAEVYNMGRAGMNATEEVELAIKESEKFHPDSIVVASILSDVISHPEKHKMVQPPKWAEQFSQWILSRPSYFLYRLYQQITIFSTDRFSSYADYLAYEYTPDSPDWADEQNDFIRLSAFADKNKIDLKIFLIPYFDSGSSAEKYENLLSLVETTISGHRVGIRNLLPNFERIQPDLTYFRYSKYDAHPNASAAVLIGNQIATYLEGTESFSKFLKKHSRN